MDPQFDLTFREQIFHNNTDFFKKPESLILKEDRLAKKYDLPTSSQIQRFKEGKDPFLIKNFDNKF